MIVADFLIAVEEEVIYFIKNLTRLYSVRSYAFSRSTFFFLTMTIIYFLFIRGPMRPRLIFAKLKLIFVYSGGFGDRNDRGGFSDRGGRGGDNFYKNLNLIFCFKFNSKNLDNCLLFKTIAIVNFFCYQSRISISPISLLLCN